MGTVVFFVLAGLVLSSSVLVIGAKNPVHSALALVAALFFTALLFITLDAHMVAALQILVYAGAIMVLFLFVIMLLNPQAAEVQKRRWWVAALVGAALLSGELIALGLSDPHRKIAAAAEPGFGSPHALAQKLFTDFVLPFEIASLLLLVALVGAVVLTRRGE